MGASLRGSRRAAALALVALACAACAACNRGAAQEALAEADQALAAAPDLEAYAPEEFQATRKALRDAHASFDAGQYTDALRSSQLLPDRIAAALSDAAKRKQQAASAWSDVATRAPQLFEAIGLRLSALSPPDGSPSERLAAARDELDALAEAWKAVSRLQEEGNVPKAVALGEDVAARAKALAVRLGVKLGPGGAPLPLPTPRPAPSPSPAAIIERTGPAPGVNP
jgi:hypothetical protein